ncbi:MAG TPA: response regulator [Verrucomicrobiae bacterium]|nr:response regulator [Verrucomicrobiae bacterium]
MTTTIFRRRIRPKRILVAEDEFMVAQTIRMALAVDGHQIELADNGRKALETFDQAKHDLVITDFKMAEMDGLELAEKVKELSPTTPVILITAFAEAIKPEGGAVSNVDVVLGKPCSIVELQAALERLFTE